MDAGGPYVNLVRFMKIFRADPLFLMGILDSRYPKAVACFKEVCYQTALCNSASNDNGVAPILAFYIYFQSAL